MPLTLKEMTALLYAGEAQASPVGVARELEECDLSTGSAADLMGLCRALGQRFVRVGPPQITDEQLAAITLAALKAVGPPPCGAFPELRRLSVMVEVVARVLDPSHIKQREMPLSRFGFVMMCVAAAQPLEYVQFCAELAHDGATTSSCVPRVAVNHGVLVYEGRKLREKPRAADWIACAPLAFSRRDVAQNAFDWLREFGVGYTVVDPTKKARAQPADQPERRLRSLMGQCIRVAPREGGPSIEVSSRDRSFDERALELEVLQTIESTSRA